MSGYLAFDRALRELPKSMNAKKDSVLFAPYDKEELLLFLPFMRALSQLDYGMVLRSRSFGEKAWKSKAMRELIKECFDLGMVIDDAWEMQHEQYSQCFVLVCSKTTSKYSFPLLSLCPSLVFLSDFTFPKALGEVLEPSMTPQAFVQKIQSYHQSQEQWRRTIACYRQSQLYHFGHSSKWLASFIYQELL